MDNLNWSANGRGISAAEQTTITDSYKLGTISGTATGDFGLGVAFIMQLGTLTNMELSQQHLVMTGYGLSNGSTATAITNLTGTMVLSH